MAENIEATYVFTVDGHSYPGFLDGYGDLRFVANPIFRDLARKVEKDYVRKVYMEGTPSSEYSDISIQKIHENTAAGVYSKEHLLSFYAGIGYSLKFLQLLPEFEKSEIVITEQVKE